MGRGREGGGRGGNVDICVSLRFAMDVGAGKSVKQPSEMLWAVMDANLFTNIYAVGVKCLALN